MGLDRIGELKNIGEFLYTLPLNILKLLTHGEFGYDMEIVAKYFKEHNPIKMSVAT